MTTRELDTSDIASIRMEVSEFFDDYDADANRSTHSSSQSNIVASHLAPPAPQQQPDVGRPPLSPTSLLLHREEEIGSGHPDDDDDMNLLDDPKSKNVSHARIDVKEDAVLSSPRVVSSPSLGRTSSTASTSLKYTVPFPVSVFNSQQGEWHSSCYIQFWFQKPNANLVIAQGFYLINDTSKTRSPEAVKGSAPGSPVEKSAWPYPTDRMFFPLSCITFLYDDDEAQDVEDYKSTTRAFCSSLSAGLHCSHHPTDGFAHKAVGDCDNKELLSFLYLPSLLLPPVHQTLANGTVVQQNDMNPWEVVSGVPIVDPFEERHLLIHCGSAEHKDELLQKLIEALQSYYEPIRHAPPAASGNRGFKDGSTAEAETRGAAEFDKKTFYRHCVRRVFHMHFVRRLLLLGASRNESMFLTLWVNQNDHDCMQQIIATMSNTGTLNKILVRLRTLVSLKKVRFMQGGFNLDLASITPNIIAMGFPSTGSQALMRNPIDDILRYFEVYWSNGTWPATKDSIKAHLAKDDAAFSFRDAEAIAAYLRSSAPCRYRVYNLCSERCYPPSRFAGSFERFPSDDHNPPPLAQMMHFCKSAEAFLKGNDTKDPNNPGSQLNQERVVAIHCKAGKGRTGVMIVALMMFMKLFDSLDVALTHYNTKRTRDGKGITIASQIRFLKYFVHTLSQIGRNIPSRRPAKIRSISFSPIPWFDMDGGCTPYMHIRKRVDNHWHHPLGQREVLSTEDDTMMVLYDSQYVNGLDGEEETLTWYVGGERATFRISSNLEVVDEIQFMFFNKGGRLLHTEYMFSFWFHTSFLNDRAAVVMYSRDEVDGASKEHREFFDPGFLVEVEYTTMEPEVFSPSKDGGFV